MALFTDKLLANLKPREKRYVVWEENHRRLGTLGVRVSRSGRRTWIFMYRFSGRARMATLGLYPRMTVAAAHAAAGALMEALERGQDPSRERLEARRELQRAPTVEKLAEDFIELYAKRRKRTWENDQATLAKHVIPRIGHLKANDVRRRDILEMLEEIAIKAPTGANRLLALVRKMYNWAAEREICEYNPCYRLSRPSPENTRDRVLTAAEIRKLWLLLDRDERPDDESAVTPTEKSPPPWISRPVRLALKLALATAQRRVEVACAARSEFDLDENLWTIPATRSKNGKEHRVPLSGLARELVEELASLAGDSDWLIPSPQGEGKEPIEPGALTRAVARLLECTDIKHFVVHDLRRTAASHMASLHISRTIIKKILNHADSDITAIYDRYGYDDEKRAALDTWAQRLREIMEKDDVAPSLRVAA
jgi:integrase